MGMCTRDEPLQPTGCSLQDRALFLAAAAAGLGDLQEGSASGSLEDFLDTLICAGRALQVLVGANLLADFLTLY